MKICPKCGTQNPDDALYCFKCGTKFDEFTKAQLQETTKLWILISYILSIFFSFIFLILFIFQLIHIFQAIPQGLFGTIYNSIIAGIYALMVVFGLLVFQRIRNVYNLVLSNRIEEAGNLITIDWIVIAIIFNGVIPGVFLLLAKIEMDNYLGKKTIL